MKLRIHDNTIRIRLTQSEVARLAAGKSVEQITEFTPTTSLISLVKPSSQVRSATATFQDNRLSVFLPLGEIQQWAQSDQVGIEANQTVGPDRTLGILIEKDFQCLHSAAEENADAFPNPRSA
jgi:hypothetical protein